MSKRHFVTTGLILLLSLSIESGVEASDHLDALYTLGNESADITALMAFTSPERPGYLVLILDAHANAHPKASPEGSKRAPSVFSDNVSYNFRLRTVESAGSDGKIDVELKDTQELRISCHLDDSQSMSCETSSGISTTVAINDESGGTSSDLLVYAGLRSDPFFMDIVGYFDTFTLQRAVALLPPDMRSFFDEPPPDETTPRVFRFTGTNTVEGANVLSIVAEVNVAEVFGPEAGPVFAVSAETMQISHSQEIR